MFKILVNALTYKGDKSDISVYVENVVHELSKNNLVYVMLFKKRVELFPIQNENVVFITYSDILNSSVIGKLWHLFVLPFCINYRKFDFMLLPEANVRLFCRYPIYTISVIHHILDSEHCRARGFFERLYLHTLVPKYIDEANILMCTSEVTMHRASDQFRVDHTRMMVNYPGYDTRKFNNRIIVDKGALKAEYGLKNKFMLYAADIKYPDNNHINLIKAYDRLPAEVKQKFELVFVGEQGVGSDVVLQYAKHSDFSNHIKFISKIPEKVIPALYKMATLYVEPSTEDVFCTRLIEAMACGTPVVCSDLPTNVEIGGDAVHCCCATDFESISMHLDAVLNFESEQEDMRSKGLKVVDNYSWEKHSNEIVSCYIKNNSSAWHKRFREQRDSDSYEVKHPERRCKASLFSIFMYLVNYCFEKITALAFLILTTVPMLFILYIRRILLGTPMFVKVDVLGHRKEPESIVYFNSRKYYIKNLTLFWYVLKGRLSLVGVGLREFALELLQSNMAYVYNHKPGVFNPWFAYDKYSTESVDRDDVEWNYILRKSFIGDIVLIYSSVIAFFKERQFRRNRGILEVLDLRLLNISRTKLVNLISYTVEKKGKRTMTFVNSKRLNSIYRDSDLFEIYRNINYLVPSGGSIGLLGQLMRFPLVEHITSVDLLPGLCDMISRNGFRVYLIGGPLGISIKMMALLKREYPELDIIGENQATLGAFRDVHSLINRVNEIQPDIVLVSMPTPEQEEWINRYSGMLCSSIVIGVGDLFEVCSGNIKRSSRVVRELGLEWAIRMFRDRETVKRFIISSPIFVVRAIINTMRGIRK